MVQGLLKSSKSRECFLVRFIHVTAGALTPVSLQSCYRQVRFICSEEIGTDKGIKKGQPLSRPALQHPDVENSFVSRPPNRLLLVVAAMVRCHHCLAGLSLHTRLIDRRRALHVVVKSRACRHQVVVYLVRALGSGPDRDA